MNSTEFVTIVKRQLEEDLPKFERNLAEEEKDYCEWVWSFIGWMEWDIRINCEHFYQVYLEEKKEIK
jgi:hypothetical protein